MKTTTASLTLFFCFALLLSPAAGKDPEPEMIQDRHGVPLTVKEKGKKRDYRFGAAAMHLTRSSTLGGLDVHQVRRGLRVTIDHRVQLAAERAMRKVGRGAAVVIDPRSGEILAMVSVPSYDPELFAGGPGPEEFAKLNQDETRPLVNRALHAYTTGSVFKPVVALATVEGGDPSRPQKFRCDGTAQYGGKTLRCWLRAPGHGELDLKRAIVTSCNCAFYEYGMAAGVDEMARVARLMGFGAKTGVVPSHESAGLVPDGAYLARRNPDAASRDGDIAMFSIGHGYLAATPLQVAGMMAAFANGGTYIRPHLVERRKPETTKLFDSGITRTRFALVRQALYAVVNSPEGTARLARIEGKHVFGKTGSAMTSTAADHRERLSWFAGFEGKSNSRFAIAVMVQGGTTGGKVAAPLAREILAECLQMPEKVDARRVTPEKLAPAKGHTDPIEEIR